MAENVAGIAPVQQIVNTRRRWEEWASGAVPPPTYDELLAAGRSDTAMLAGYATGNVHEAYRLGRDMRVAYDRSRALLLRGLDLLHDAVAAIAQVQAAADAVQAGEPVAPEVHERASLAAQHAALTAAAEQALALRQRAIDELAHALATAALGADQLNATAAAAARYEQGAVGAPPVPPPVGPG